MNKMPEAVEYYSRALALKPDDTRVLEDRAHALSSAGNYEEELKDKTKMIELHPDDSNNYFARATTYECMREYRKAIDDYTQSLARRNTCYTHERRAQVYKELGMMEKYEEDMKASLELSRSGKDESTAPIGRLLHK